MHNNSEFAVLKETKRRENVYDPRNSEETASNRHSGCEKHFPSSIDFSSDLKKGCIFEGNNLSIKLSPVHRKPSTDPLL